MGELERSHERFQTTRWTQLRDLAEGDDADRREVLEALSPRYWPVVYAHLRSKGARRDDAAELTQSFFSDVVLGRDLFERADEARGKLRTLILTALDRHRIDRHRRREARGASATIPLDAVAREEAMFDAIDQAPGSDDLFDRRWAVTALSEALRRAEAHFRRTGRRGHWALFEKRVLRPATSGGAAPPLADLMEGAGFDSPALAAAAVQVVKRRITGLLREVVAETVGDDREVESELEDVRRLLART